MKFIQNTLLFFVTIIITIILLNLIIVFNSLKVFDQNFLPIFTIIILIGLLLKSGSSEKFIYFDF